MVARTDNAVKRYRAAAFASTCHGTAILLFVVAFVGAFIAARVGASGVVVALAVVVPALALAYLVWLAATGGATLRGDRLRLRGFLRSSSVAAAEVRGVAYRHGRTGGGRGWLDLPDRKVPLRGVVTLHQHDLVVSDVDGPFGTRASCPECVDQLRLVKALASDLDVPVVELSHPTDRPWPRTDGQSWLPPPAPTPPVRRPPPPPPADG